jgi:hypothetical protein
MHDQMGYPHQPARRPAQRPAAPTKRRGSAGMSRTPFETLEGRTLFAVTSPVNLSVEPNVNITQLLENQHSPTITVNRQDPGNIFISSTSDRRGTGPLDDTDLNLDRAPDPLPGFDDSLVNNGVLSNASFNAGDTFVGGGLAPNAQAPAATFDEFGNLFLTYFVQQFITITDPDTGATVTIADDSSVEVAMSTDGGLSFQLVDSFDATLFGVIGGGGIILGANQFFTESAQPSIAAGAGSVWVSFESNGQIVATGSRVRGLGEVEGFIDPVPVFRSEGGKFSDVAIGPDGEVMVSYLVPRFDPDVVIPDEEDLIGGTIIIGPGGNFISGDAQGPADVYVNVDPDGLGPLQFQRRTKATDTTVGAFDPVPAQNDRTINAQPRLAWDRSGGAFNGRVYMVYTDEPVDENGSDTDIYLRFSDDDGKTWSGERKVTDEDFTTASQFLPRVAVDQVTGNVAVTWYDTREPVGLSAFPLEETQYWGTVGVPTIGDAGVSFAPNTRISQGTSNPVRGRGLLELGEYSALDFHNNVLYAAWGDNSNFTGDNPSGAYNSGTALATLDIYTTRVIVTPATPVQEPQRAPVGPGSPLTPQFVGKDTLTKGKVYKFQVRYTSESGINLATLGDDDILITGPNGYSLPADFTKGKLSKRGTVATATYLAAAPGGKFDLGDNGLYSILLNDGAVADLAGTTIDPGLLDQFLVSSTLPPQSPALQPASAALEAAADDDLRKAVGL